MNNNLKKNMTLLCCLVVVNAFFDDAVNIKAANAFNFNKEIKNLKDKINAATKEKQTLQKTLDSRTKDLNDSTQKMEDLQKRLDDAINESKQISAEKERSEETATSQLSETQNEIKQLTDEMNSAKDSASKQIEGLNAEMAQLKNEITEKQSEISSLTNKAQASEKAMSEYKTKAEAEKKSLQTEYSQEKQKLNDQIKLLKSQIKAKQTELKKLIAERETQTKNSGDAHATTLEKIEELKAVVLSEKNRLKQMIDIGKSSEAEQKEYEKALNQKLELERAYFQEIITQNHAREAQLTQEISISSTKIAQLQENLNRLAKMSSNMIQKYKETINHLKDQISKIKQNYSRSQLKNFSRINTLKSKWDSLSASHKKALAYAKKMEKNKALKDVADSKIEANRLHTIASLKTKLSNSEQANINILTKISALEQKLQKCDQIAKSLYKYNSKHKKWKIRKLNARLKNNRRHPNLRQNTASGNILSTSAQDGEPEDVTIAVSSVLNAVLKLNNYNMEKTNASMNILASGRELPEKMKAILEVLQERFNPEILEKALQKISSIYDRKQTRIMNALENAYGEAAAEQIIDWNVIG